MPITDSADSMLKPDFILLATTNWSAILVMEGLLVIYKK